jgi:hypothetical protein
MKRVEKGLVFDNYAIRSFCYLVYVERTSGEANSIRSSIRQIADARIGR